MKTIIRALHECLTAIETIRVPDTSAIRVVDDVLMTPLPPTLFAKGVTRPTLTRWRKMIQLSIKTTLTRFPIMHRAL